MIMMEELIKIYGPSCTTDSPFAAKARFHQSWYRENVLKEHEYGFGPEATAKTKYGNILVNGQHTGSNFLTPLIFKYAQHRRAFLKKEETIQEYRLFNNMLSSQPMCFNLFFPLKALFETDHITACNIFKACFPDLKIARILQVEIEYLPYPVGDYLNDKTAFDAMLLYVSETGKRNILAIETKYVEKLGTNPSSDLSSQVDLVNQCILFNDCGKEKAIIGFSQLGRNFLLAEKFRMENRFDEAFAVVISPRENDSSPKEIKEFGQYLQPEFASRLFYLSLEQIVTCIGSLSPKHLQSWINELNKRYQGFSESESIYKEYRK